MGAVSIKRDTAHVGPPMSVSFNNSITCWIEDLKENDARAASELWNRYFERLVRLARRKLGSAPRRAIDEEDVAVSVFGALCSGASAGRFSDLQNRDDLWRLLVAICAQKVVDLIRHETRQKRGGGNVRGHSVFGRRDGGEPRDFDAFMREEPTPEFLNMLAEEHDRLMASLADDSLREIARLRVEGFANEEIAEHVGVSLRTVERKLRSIREAWETAGLGRMSVTTAAPVGPATVSLPLHVLEPHMHESRFAPGDCLMRQGDVGDSLMVIRDGEVDVVVTDESGKKHTIDEGSRGSVFGEMALLTSEPRSANVVARSGVTASVLPAAAFHELAKLHTELCVVLTNLVAERLGQNDRDALSDKVLDRYRIRSVVGRGGMGVVYEAETVDAGECVALKMMSHRLVYDRQARDRFEQEADIIESFKHPHIVGMHGRFMAFHTYFICLEYCDGGSLADAIEASGPLPAEQIQQVFSQVAFALDYAHREGIVHRDVKPANILFAGQGDAKLTDFGLSGPIDDEKSAGRLYGTPRYMAPEQLAGAAAGKEADYFALGCVAFEMITGRPLFTAKGLPELCRAHAAWEIPSVRDLRSDLDDALCCRVQSCLQKEPGLRNPNSA